MLLRPDQALPTACLPAELHRLVLAAAMLSVAACGGPTPAQQRASDALERCQFAIKRVSRNEAQTIVPYVANSGSEFQFRFEWQPGSGLQMPNGFGAMQDTTALCVVQDDRLQELVVEGRTILKR